jgi:ribosome recycling factor
VAIRNIRRDANHSFKEMIKNKSIPEDEERRSEERVQKLTDDHITLIDKLIEEKESELMEI